jgi:hypothetical protein
MVQQFRGILGCWLKLAYAKQTIELSIEFRLSCMGRPEITTTYWLPPFFSLQLSRQQTRIWLAVHHSELHVFYYTVRHPYPSSLPVMVEIIVATIHHTGCHLCIILIYSLIPYLGWVLLWIQYMASTTSLLCIYPCENEVVCNSKNYLHHRLRMWYMWGKKTMWHIIKFSLGVVLVAQWPFTLLIVSRWNVVTNYAICSWNQKMIPAPPLPHVWNVYLSCN